MVTVEIPNRPVFRAQEVCEIAQVQPFQLRSWEAEFPDLGVEKKAGTPRVYRRVDVQRVVRIKQLLLDEGFTLAGVRRQLSQEGMPVSDETVEDADVAAMLDHQTRESLQTVRRGLQWILGVLDGHGLAPEDFVLVADPGRRAAPARRARGGSAKAASPAKVTRPAKASTKSPAKARKKVARPARKQRSGPS